MRIIIFLVLVVSLGFNGKAQCNDNPKDAGWYRNAEEYIYCDDRLTQDLSKEEKSFMENYEARYQAETDLLRSAAPSDAEICELLASSSILDRNVALVNIMARKMKYNQDIYTRIISLLKSENAFFTRFYSYHCLNLLDADKIRYFKDDLIDVFSFEENETLKIAGMPVLVKIDSPQIVPIFLKYLDQGSDGLRRSACVYLFKIDKKYLEENKTLLRKKTEICE